MTQPEGQPTTMTVREQLEANGLKHLYDMRTLDRDSRSYGERVEDILTTLISNAKEEERKMERNRIIINHEEYKKVIPTPQQVPFDEEYWKSLVLDKGQPILVSYSNNPKP